jgi:hypothetical protein
MEVSKNPPKVKGAGKTSADANTKAAVPKGEQLKSGVSGAVATGAPKGAGAKTPAPKAGLEGATSKAGAELKPSAPKAKAKIAVPVDVAPIEPPAPPAQKKPQYKTLIAICNPKMQDWLIERLTAMGASAVNIFLAEGIKRTQLLDLLGFVDNQKILVVCLVKEDNVPQIFELLKTELFTGPNTGIAFTINIDAYAGIKTMIMLDSYILKLENERAEDK